MFRKLSLSSFKLTLAVSENNLIPQWPGAIALNYNVKNIWNDVRQILYIYIYINIYKNRNSTH